MANWFVYACEQHFQGYHGIETYDVFYDIDEEDANSNGHDMSIEVMESYSAVMDGIEEDAEQWASDEGIAYETIDDNEREEWMANAIAELEEENTSWYIRQLRDDLTDEDKEQISLLLHRGDPDEIIKQYGIKE